MKESQNYSHPCSSAILNTKKTPFSLTWDRIRTVSVPVPGQSCGISVELSGTGTGFSQSTSTLSRIIPPVLHTHTSFI